MKKNKGLFYVLAAVSSVCIICLVAVIAMESDSIFPSASPDQQVKSLLSDALGSSNRDVQHLTDVQWNEPGKILNIRWTINDNLTDEMIIYGAKLDIVNMLEAISKKGIPYDYQLINFDGSFPLVDVYGNATEERVVLATFQRAQISLVNWDNFITDNIYLLADSIWLHPTFQ